MSERKTKLEMAGELLRDLGLLVAVFGVMEGKWNHASGWWYAGVAVTTLLGVGLGMLAERVRPK